MEQGIKFDDDKNRWDLIPYDALDEVIKIYTLGAKKYGDGNWRKGFSWGRIFGAVMRHLTAFWCGIDRDESGEYHLAHAAWGILTLIWMQKNKKGTDDRFSTIDRNHGGCA